MISEYTYTAKITIMVLAIIRKNVLNLSFLSFNRLF